MHIQKLTSGNYNMVTKIVIFFNLVDYFPSFITGAGSGICCQKNRCKPLDKLIKIQLSPGLHFIRYSITISL